MHSFCILHPEGFPLVRGVSKSKGQFATSSEHIIIYMSRRREHEQHLGMSVNGYMYMKHTHSVKTTTVKDVSP